MADEEQDQITFEITPAAGGRHLARTVPAGEGRSALANVLKSESRWIQVSDSEWILRDHVLLIRLILADEERGPLIASV